MRPGSWLMVVEEEDAEEEEVVCSDFGSGDVGDVSGVQ